jgi:hypothetical protein
MTFYESKSRVQKIAGTERRITLETGTSFEVGVHGAIKAHYHLLDQKELPLPVDYIVGATGA